jgi:hypothetical protein
MSLLREHQHFYTFPPPLEGMIKYHPLRQNHRNLQVTTTPAHACDRRGFEELLGRRRHYERIWGEIESEL